MVKFSKFTPKKEIYEKFEKFLSKLVWRETLFVLFYRLDKMLDTPLFSSNSVWQRVSTLCSS